MSELRSALEAFRSEDLASLPDARLKEDFCELQWASELVDAERLRRLAEIERRGVHGRDGFLSAAFLAGQSVPDSLGMGPPGPPLGPGAG